MGNEIKMRELGIDLVAQVNCRVWFLRPLNDVRCPLETILFGRTESGGNLSPGT